MAETCSCYYQHITHARNKSLVVFTTAFTLTIFTYNSFVFQRFLSLDKDQLLVPLAIRYLIFIIIIIIIITFIIQEQLQPPINPKKISEQNT
jgi:hypothetical protein